ncbi:hypothetical protein FHR81_002263 [Actinoalloteichus hoggarensis]|uniref:Uncharacterized protein n=1 Tax=Actinoalloteichus hoggarensis TaxID=1470176 RepID=A0A221W6K0_9PSEU|nr:hypothetical protein AHOG_18340 [Actinoalloteichus hoggarensis]MBB5921225.1 hypothetical protein [Actinoalloteichus hoggarensis]
MRCRAGRRPRRGAEHRPGGRAEERPRRRNRGRRSGRSAERRPRGAARRSHRDTAHRLGRHAGRRPRRRAGCRLRRGPEPGTDSVPSGGPSPGRTTTVPRAGRTPARSARSRRPARGAPRPRRSGCRLDGRRLVSAVRMPCRSGAVAMRSARRGRRASDGGSMPRRISSRVTRITASPVRAIDGSHSKSIRSTRPRPRRLGPGPGSIGRFVAGPPRPRGEAVRCGRAGGALGSADRGRPRADQRLAAACTASSTSR